MTLFKFTTYLFSCLVLSILVGCTSENNGSEQKNTQERSSANHVIQDFEGEDSSSSRDASSESNGQYRNSRAETDEYIRVIQSEKAIISDEWQLACGEVRSLEISDEVLEQDDRRLKIEMRGRHVTLDPTPIAKALDLSSTVVINGVFFLPGDDNALDPALTPTRACGRVLFNPVLPGRDCLELGVAVMQSENKLVIQLRSGDTTLTYGPTRMQAKQQRSNAAEEKEPQRAYAEGEVDGAGIDSDALASLFPDDEGSWRTNTSLQRPPYDRVVEFICYTETDGDGLCGFPDNPNADLPFSTTTLRMGIDKGKERLKLVPLEYLADDVCTTTPLSELELKPEYHLRLPQER